MTLLSSPSALIMAVLALAIAFGCLAWSLRQWQVGTPVHEWLLWVGMAFLLGGGSWALWPIYVGVPIVTGCLIAKAVVVVRSRQSGALR